ncbi:Beta-xylosidase [Aquiflexum balticum DSM 16537]|uniref:Beta-xylosidase n=1 Tax=Aquiflexum balticum DSM 16537 TaxID=758820 RepID=A0A1W2H2W1_9BACT|nr:glycoside hydrolase family 43 protein [Aquiflexum balticum]SMD43270.1 Beta-xylosidase [Aquiflexum balticum DSM 16537]
MKQFVFLFLFLFSGIIAFAQTKAFKPGQVWYDTEGHPINAHGGGFLFHEGTYYWFGQIMIPGKRGSDAWVGVSCYSSTDLYNWENEGVAFHVEDHASHQVTRGSKIERPKVIFNEKTKKFVMWWHHDINGQGHKNAMAGIAISDNVSGPYQFVRVFRPLSGFLPFNVSEEDLSRDIPEMAMTYPFNGGELPVSADSLLLYKRDIHIGQMVRDMTLFVDDDGKAYHIYSSEENSTLHIAELSADYLGYTGKFARFFSGRFMEAPTLFKRNGKYYMINSGCTGWNPNEARSAWAPSIWGPWEEFGNPSIGKESEITFNSQGTFVLPVQGKKNAYIFVADRWNPANPIDGRYVWLPISFEGERPILRWKDTWDLEIFD